MSDDLIGNPIGNFDTPEGLVASWLLYLADIVQGEETLQGVIDTFEPALMADLRPGWEEPVAEAFDAAAYVLSAMAKRARQMDGS